MAEIQGDSGNNILEGTSDYDIIRGGAGNDTLIGGVGPDFLDGQEGTDIAVFNGNRDEYDIYRRDGLEAEFAIFVEDTDGRRDFVKNVEILRFDDQDAPVLAALDNIGDTPDTGRTLVSFGTKGRDVFSDASYIDSFDDVDLFKVRLKTSATYRLDLIAASLGDIQINGVINPDGVPIAGTNISLESFVEFTTSVAGTHTFSVAGLGGQVGRYAVRLEEIQTIGEDTDNDLRGTAGDDVLIPGGGRNTVDGDAGTDTVLFEGNFADYSFEVRQPGTLSADERAEVYVWDGTPPEVEPERSSLLRNVERLRFDDQEISILALIDDAGSTNETAGSFEDDDSFFAGPGDQVVDGRIDLAGDIDVFAIELEAGEIVAYGFDDFDFGSNFNNPDDEYNGPFILTNIAGPGDAPFVERQFDERGAGLSKPTFLRADQTGLYYFTIAATAGTIGEYTFNVRKVSGTSSSSPTDARSSPFDDELQVDENYGRLNLSLQGNDSVFGTESVDYADVFTFGEDVEIRVLADDRVVLTSELGSATFTDIEEIEVYGLGETPDGPVRTADLVAMSQEWGEGDAIQLHLLGGTTDSYEGGNDDQVVRGNFYDNVITGTGGVKVVYADDGEDRVGLLNGTNFVEGGQNADLIIGGIGRDILLGGTGEDIIRGDVSANFFGADTITGGSGNDLLEGGGGQDVFVFRPFEGSNTIGALEIDFDAPSNTSVVGSDFVPGLDKIQLEGFGFSNGTDVFESFDQVDGGARFSDQSTSILFTGLAVEDLSPDDFILI